ncbi:MAG TPA: NAD(P)H-hydrate dehydratase, partial [Stellaceae bacterium]
DLQAIVALKGACTYIATPDGDLYAHDQGCVGLATSGSGDTLGGILAGLLARGAPPLDATLWAVYLHGAAGRAIEQRRGLLGLLARELLDEIPQIMNALSRDRE